MAQRKKKSTKPRKKPQKKVERHLTRALANSILRLLKWLFVSLAKLMRKNPLVSIGFCLFLGFFSFLAYHSSFNQSIVKRSFFFQNSEETSHNSANHVSSANNLTVEDLLQANNPPITAYQAEANNNTASAQNIEHPATNPVTKSQPIPVNRPPSLSIIPQVKPQTPRSNNNLPTSILSKEKAQIMRVQAALRSFGNNDLIVNGIVDNTTKNAIIAFQKMFALKQTGVINRELLTKMREVGLIPNDTNGLY